MQIDHIMDKMQLDVYTAYESYKSILDIFDKYPIEDDVAKYEMEKCMNNLLKHIENLEATMEKKRELIYVIRNKNNSSKYWNNMAGWVVTNDIEEMTTFNAQQKQNFTLFSNGEWVLITEK